MSSWADWSVVAILVMGVFIGLAQGFFRSFCSLAGLFLGMVLAIWNYGYLEKSFRWAGLGCVDTLLGAIFGFLEGAMLVMVIVLMTVAFFPGTVWLTEA